MRKPNLDSSVGSIKLENPSMLASGILGETAESMMRAMKNGAGGVVTKSIGLEPRDGYLNPTVYSFQEGLLNAMGLPNPGIENYKQIIEKLKRESGGIVIGSIFGKDEQEFGALAKTMSSLKVDALELNLSCPHAKGVGSEIGSDPDMVKRVVKSAKTHASVPVWAKLTPNTDSISSLAISAEKGGADAIVAINTVRAMAISARLRMPVLSNRYGGLSGKAVKYVGLRCVYEIYESVHIPVIGVGGIYTGEDVAEYLMAGASAFEIGTAVAERGPQVFSAVNRELLAFMKKEHFSTIGEMIGIAHRQT